MVKLSVIMTVYNGEQHIRESIESILNQEYKNFEFLILNDGSTDKTQEIIESYQDERIKVYNIGKIGRAQGLNYLLNKAKGRYIANLDADDIALVHRFKLQVDYLDNHNEVVLLGTKANFIDEDGKLLTNNVSEGIKTVNNSLGKKCPINHSSVMYRLNNAISAGMYNEKLLKQVDYEFWIRLAQEGDLNILPEVCVLKRLHQDQKFESGGLKYQFHAIRIQKKAIRELKLSKKNYLYVYMRYIYYIFGINRILNRNINIKIQNKITRL